MLRNIFSLALLATVLSVLLVFASPAEAAPGDLDATFSGDGKLTTAIGEKQDEAYDVAVQKDGKIVVAGHFSLSNGTNFALVRYNPNGTLDTSFGNGGKVTGSGLESANALAIQSDGKIVVAGYTYNSTTLFDFALVRYNPNGTPDTSFGTDGVVSTPIGPKSDRARALAIQSDGKIVVAGYTYSSTTLFDFALARYNANGTLDTTFDGDGKVTTPIGSGHDLAEALALQSDGKIVVAGSSYGSTIDFALARYNPNGSLDTTFSGDGKVTTGVGPKSDYANGLALQGDGKIVVAGNSNSGGVYDNLALVRYSGNGSLDTTFSGDGKLVTTFGTGHSIGNDVSVQGDGKIVLAGYFGTDADYDFALARTNPNGSLDSSFSGDGKVTTPIGSGHDFAHALALQSDGKIVVAGSSFNGIDSGYDFALARYEGDDITPPDTTITSGPSGIVKSTSATFRFVSSEPGSKFQCRLDGAAFSVCASPKSYTNLKNGRHIFRVRAIDPAGNIDPTPAVRAWRVDTIKPSISGLKPKPNSKTRDRTPTVKAIVKDNLTNLSKGHIKLYVDGKQVPKTKFSYNRSTDRLTYTSKKLSLGKHTVKIVARDKAGNVAVRKWSFKVVRR